MYNPSIPMMKAQFQNILGVGGHLRLTKAEAEIKLLAHWNHKI